MPDDVPLLEVRNLQKYFKEERNIVQTLLRREPSEVQAVDGVSFSLEQNDSIAIIGESGCGKTTLLMTLIGLHDMNGGDIFYKGNPVSEFNSRDWKQYRQNVQVIFQDPFNSLDPKMSVEDTLKEPLRIHGIGDKDRRVKEILTQVELDPPEKFLHRKPKQLSGGEKQRISIARALILEPDIVLADEPVSMLDVSTQASVLNMLDGLVEEFGVAMVYISHDLSTVVHVTDRVNVMYLGRVVESAPVRQLLDEQKHPYTRELMNAVPIPDPSHDREQTTLSGAPRDPVNLGEGCRFRDRCPDVMDICETTPEFVEVAPDWETACHLHTDNDHNTDQQYSTEEGTNHDARVDTDSTSDK